MATAQTRPKLMTVEEFLAWDGGGHVGKLELVDGVVRAMAPASATHSIIQADITAAIHNHLRTTGSKCRVGTEAPVVPPLRKRINARAPDLAVTCAPPSGSKTFEEPILIVEVLSPSNESETWESIRAVALDRSVREVLAVESEVVEAHVFRRSEAGDWGEPVMVRAGGVIRLTSIGLEMPMAEVYRGTHLAG